MYDLRKDNLENNIYTTILDFNKLQSSLFSGYIFSNIDKIRYHLVFKLISAMNNFANDNSEKTKPLIIYSTNGYLIYLNNWEDKHYFIRVFPTLYLFGDSGYLA